MPIMLMMGVTLVMMTVNTLICVMDKLVVLGGMVLMIVSMFIIMRCAIHTTAIMIINMENLPMIVVTLFT